jgi:hypothetical protein
MDQQRPGVTIHDITCACCYSHVLTCDLLRNLYVNVGHFTVLVRGLGGWVLLNDTPQSALPIATEAQLRELLFHELTAAERRSRSVGLNCAPFSSLHMHLACIHRLATVCMFFKDLYTAYELVIFVCPCMQGDCGECAQAVLALLLSAQRYRRSSLGASVGANRAGCRGVGRHLCQCLMCFIRTRQ